MAAKKKIAQQIKKYGAGTGLSDRQLALARKKAKKKKMVKKIKKYGAGAGYTDAQLTKMRNSK